MEKIILPLLIPLIFLAGNVYGLTHITNCEELQAMQNNLSEDYVLDNDINCSDTVNWNDGAGFIPIGNQPNAFTGTFDGQGYNITNLYINREQLCIGLFGKAGNIIQNVSVINISIYAGGSSVIGGLVGEFSTSYNTSLSNIHITGNIEGYNYVGGLIGHNHGNGNIINSDFTGNIIGNHFYIGGLTGYNEGTIANSYANGSVSGNTYIGGLIGWNEGGEITNSSASGNVIGSTGGIGGLIGTNNGAVISNSYANGNVHGYNGATGGLVGHNNGIILYDYATGDISGNNYLLGGLAGYNTGTISNSYATGETTASTSFAQEIGGLIGCNVGLINNSYSIGKVSGNIETGGLSGRNEGTILNSYWDIETSGFTTSAGGEGKTTAEMKRISTFTNWDFVEIWGIEDNQTYPFLKLTYPVSDLNYDKVVNFLDLAILAAH